MIKKGLPWIGCTLLAGALLLPIVMTLLSSFMCGEELCVVYSKGHAFRWIPYQVTLSGYWRLLFESQTYLSTFWNSMFIASVSTAFQVVISLIVSYALVRIHFRGKKALTLLYVMLMLMPFQVTLLPNYLLAKEIHIYNTWLALVLPAAFAPLGVFLMRELIRKLPEEMIEAAYMDTSSNLSVITSIVVPNIQSGILTVAILSFAETWNMVEQPLILLESEWLYPLSLRLSMLGNDSLDIYFSGAVFYIIPAILIYVLFRDEFMEGIKHMKL